MRSKKITINVPWPLAEVFEDIAPKVGYEGKEDGTNSARNQFILWSAVYAVVVGKYHHVTAPIAAASQEVQDQIIQEIVDNYKRGEFPRGSFFEAVLADVIQRFNLPVPAEVVHATIADTVRKRPKRSKEK